MGDRATTAPARYVVYQYCISIVILTFKRSSGIRRIGPGESAVVPGLPYTLISLLFGWWGIPWGPIYTIQTVVRNLQGGIDVTEALLASSVPAVDDRTATITGQGMMAVDRALVELVKTKLAADGSPNAAIQAATNEYLVAVTDPDPETAIAARMTRMRSLTAGWTADEQAELHREITTTWAPNPTDDAYWASLSDAAQASYRAQGAVTARAVFRR